MSYTVKEIFPTLQGEGAHAGRTAVFCRFTGCNLWSGLERDRARATCRFCDTDFIGTDGAGGGRFASASLLADAIAAHWPAPDRKAAFVVFTGGEPLLQLDDALITAVHARGFEIAVETNGTLRAPGGIDWICVSPKAGAPLVQTSGHELKLVYPQPDLLPGQVAGLDFSQFWLQPMDNAARDHNTRAAVDYCLHHPQWRLSLQTHKLIGIP
ncbi:7-carboxy-7-deazaguanine synthase-like protein [Gluconacetobacter sp. SXCC-1]|uniref:7-carboxy-7-deazaguanine synthase n=1 Tax=Komagataeibacter rhaeticus TaxID=215221 RepID=A0A181C965_9PROT|nr:7-carboxy-7-deazaguanine synthase [Komagataeibacter rhaeticus]ATU72244.1 7-carboxy-7-deazaguanine synthase [Komagataeibacter xylinus]EGG75278.1 7-carboxy-7-deazaguanine synthase-like protein [Gluconacetobacter sp. SXCC-1]QIP34967.1 7-carboxy-7-deazaguanine synthase [Komagataeibacter rhaeticus]QOC47504.1 7-carboxy-7-deazaguanine synthase [Komagataeibacter rhaeticus]WPP21972.1 7-carboxy-7-deazaguanine synthase [Komagataeibacter rhaeticus]